MRRVLALIAIAGCHGGSSALEGAVQKGPFVLGSTLDVAVVDDAGAPTGLVFPTSTTDDLGSFAVELPGPSLVSMHADGFWFDEVTGGLSAAPIGLDAFADSDGDGGRYVNLVTDLAYGRTATLLANGAEFSDAVEQAEFELRVALSIGTDGFDPGAPGTAMNALGGDDDPNAYGLAVSATLVQAAIDEAGADGPLDATLQQLVNTFAADLADDGNVAPGLTAQIDGAQANVDVELVMANLAARVTDLGGTAEIPDLHRVIDGDLDALADASDNCPTVANSDQVDDDHDGVGDACQCGNGVASSNEECDDGDHDDGDGCNADCTLPRCGNGIADPLELCLAEFSRLDVTDVNLTEVRLVADLDGDGVLDLLVARQGTYNVWVLLNDGTGVFAEPAALPGANTDQLLRIAAGDLDDDGDTDLVAAIGSPVSSAFLGFRAYLNDGAGGFTIGAEMPHAVDGGLYLADVDGGALDLVWVNNGNTSSIEWFSGDGTGGFDAGQSSATSGPLSVEVVADVDGDGVVDLIETGDGTEVMSRWELAPDAPPAVAETAPIVASSDPCEGRWRWQFFYEDSPRGRVFDVDGDGEVEQVRVWTCDSVPYGSLIEARRFDGGYQATQLGDPLPVVPFSVMTPTEGRYGTVGWDQEFGIAAIGWTGTAFEAGPITPYDQQPFSDILLGELNAITYGDFTGDGRADLAVIGRNEQGAVELRIEAAGD